MLLMPIAVLMDFQMTVPHPASAPKPPLVLVVEDDDNIAAALEFSLVRAGYGHDRVSNGSDALPRIRSTHPDLVLLDVMLPERSGYDICADLRRDPTITNTKVVLMTARGSARDRAQGLSTGADGFVSKPFDLKLLMAEVGRHLSARSDNRPF